MILVIGIMPDTLLQELKDLLEGSKKPSNVIRSKKYLIDYINNKIKEDYPLMEKVFLLVNNLEQRPTCPCGNDLRFESVFSGYPTKFCGNRKCEFGNKSRLSKVKETNLKKYGVEFPFQNKDFQEKKQKTFDLKYGGNPVYLDSVRNKISKTNMERYGSDVIAKSPVIRSKILDSFAKKYGEGITTPFAAEQVQTFVKETNLKKYGVEFPLQSEVVRNKIKENNTTKWGHPNPTYIGKNKESLKILLDSQMFRDHYSDIKSIPKMAELFGLDKTTLYKYAGLYGLQIHRLSKYEVEISEFLDRLNVNYVKHDRSILGNREIDFLIPEYNLGIEFHGLFWHSEINGKTKEYHLDKYKRSKEKGIHLIQIWENEWLGKRNIIERYILNLLGRNKSSIGARSVFITEAKSSVVNQFLEKTHIQGRTTQISKGYGAYYRGQLVGVITFFNKKGIWELTRFSTSENVPGLFSKMLKKFVEEYNPEYIQTFSDNRWFKGDVYSKSGWQKKEDYPPVYFYTDYKAVWHRFNMRKDKIKQKYSLDVRGKTEKQLVEELGLDKIWDAGKIKWVLNLDTCKQI